MAKSGNWVLIDPFDGNVGGPGGRRAVYGLDGDQYPRLVLSVVDHQFWKVDSVRISCYQRLRGGMWESFPVPRSLLPDLAKLIEEEIRNPTPPPTDEQRLAYMKKTER